MSKKHIAEYTSRHLIDALNQRLLHSRHVVVVQRVHPGLRKRGSLTVDRLVFSLWRIDYRLLGHLWSPLLLTAVSIVCSIVRSVSRGHICGRRFFGHF